MLKHFYSFELKRDMYIVLNIFILVVIFQFDFYNRWLGNITRPEEMSYIRFHENKSCIEI